ncbi:NACHT domain-containing protein [Streptomyces lincolnensis]|uniref:NACHT domain-containing protein n=1 Tax=Streptomyces lincolnensis TaxID=1915 RepID=UPI001E4527B1|nr:NACHT domain-containing protein [Streptomyces lincolnensis]MCD7441908.1 NACHT domain-containing protein [Streptomyces lincolnensis]
MSGVAPRSRVRRVGIVYVTLLCTGTLGVLLVVPWVDDPATVIAGLLPTGAGAYLAWSAYRADRVEAAAASTSPGVIADRLATAVRRQWEAEAQVRRLADPWPLPVAWRGADPGLAEVTEGLSGRDGELGAIFAARVPDRRLLVLGDPGSGKTLLLVRLVLALIEDRAGGDPVPVLFPLASWDPTAVDLRGWMERKLVQDHPELGATAPGEYGRSTLAAMLLDRRLVLPVLDGFDELAAEVSASALHRIGEALPYGRGLVLSSRPAEYRAALRPRAGVPARLSGTAGIRLEPLGAEDVAAYLLRDAGGADTSAARRWAPVVAVLGTDTPVAQALTSPLMVALARSVYNPRPGEGDGDLPDPGELVRCPTRAVVERHLLDAFVESAYRPRARRTGRWTARQARVALTFVARHLRRGRDGAAEVAWWTVNAVVPGVLPRVLAGLLLGTLGWLLEGASGELMHHLTRARADEPHWEQAGALGVLAAGICGGLVGGLTAALLTTGLCAVAAGSTLSAGLVLNGLAAGTAMTLAGMVIAGFSDGVRPVLRPPSAWDRRALLAGVGAACLYAVAFRNGCGTVGALLYGLLAAAVGADGPRPHYAPPMARVQWSWSPRGVLMGCAGGALLGAVFLVEGLLAGVLVDRSTYTGSVAPPGGPITAIWFATQQGAMFAVACLLLRGMRMAPVEPGAAVDGRALLRNDRRILTTCVATATLLGTAVIGAQNWLMTVIVPVRVWGSELSGHRLWPVLVGLVPALLVGLAAALRQAAWPCYTAARHYLALRSGLPRDLMGFLADAHDRGVLRRVGAVYQFRHIELQHRLAADENSVGR